MSAYVQQTERRMNPIAEFTAGTPYLARGFKIIREPRLRRYVLIPLLINIVLVVALVGLFGWQLDNWLDAWLAGLPDWLAWLETVLWWLGLITVALLFCYFFTFLATLVAGPFNGILSAKVEHLVTGTQPDSDMTLAGEMADGVVGTARMLGFSLTRAALLGVVSLILIFLPPLNAAIPALWFVFGAFMLAFEYLDAPMGNRGMKFRTKLDYVRARRWRHIGFGSVVTLVTAIPIINLMVMPAAVAGATLLYLDTMQKPQA